jgi:hypothetical protein
MSRARFAIPADMKARIKDMRQTELYRKAKPSCAAYGLGCEEGNREAGIFFQALMEKHPDVYGGRLANLLMDASGIADAKSDAEQGYRRGWIVGMAFALECWLYERAKSA